MFQLQLNSTLINPVPLLVKNAEAVLRLDISKIVVGALDKIEAEVKAEMAEVLILRAGDVAEDLEEDMAEAEAKAAIIFIVENVRRKNKIQIKKILSNVN